GAQTNRVVVSKAVVVQSVNGPALTLIRGYRIPGAIHGDSAVRCVYLTNGAILSGFTLTNGATRGPGLPVEESYGGALWCETNNPCVTNCVITGNAGADGAGGSYYGSFFNCSFSNNIAPVGAALFGGGAVNCLLSSNAASYIGGGA